MTKLLFLAGSARKDSLNKKLAKYACDLAAKHDDIEAEFIDLKDYEMPLYDGDLEDAKGLPEATKRLKEKFIACDGFFIANPEYNSSITPLLKNTVDWMTRPHMEDEPRLAAFAGKTCALAAASPGGLGGMRVLPIVRSLFSNIDVLVIPQQMSLGNGFDAFDENGALIKDADQKRLKGVIESFVRVSKALST